MSNRKIYVSVPTMNDREFIPTLERCLESASDNSNIIIGSSIFWKPKDITEMRKPFFVKIKEKFDSIKNIKMEVLPFDSFPGVGNGRVQSLKFYDNEKYYLSIDSHTQFEDSWDEKLIDCYEDTRKVFGAKRVLTSYLPGYFTDENDEIIRKDDFTKWQYFCYDHTRSKTFPVPMDRAIREDDNPILQHLIDGKYLPAKKISAHFTFTEGYDWVTNCRINLDPRIIFWAEEFYQSALAYSRGYNFVWVNDIFLRHLYSNSVCRMFDSETGSIKEEGEILDRSFDKEYFSSDMEVNEFYKKYIKDKLPWATTHLVAEEVVLKELLDRTGYFGSMPRSPLGFCKYSGIDIENKICRSWTEVPELDVLFK